MITKNYNVKMNHYHKKLQMLKQVQYLDAAQKIGDVTVLATRVDAKDNNQLRQMMDDLKEKMESAVIVLGAVDGDKVMLCAGVTKDIVGGNYHAGNIVKHSSRTLWW